MSYDVSSDLYPPREAWGVKDIGFFGSYSVPYFIAMMAMIQLDFPAGMVL
jgi:hypothetical protein